MENTTQLLKNRLLKLGYNFKELADSVILIPNFFKDEDFTKLWDIVNNATQEDWEKDYRESQISLAIKKFGRDDLDNLLAEGLMQYTDHWHDKAIEIPESLSKELSKNLEEVFNFETNPLFVGGLQTIQRQYENSPLIEHVDNDADPDIAYAAIGYMNDDYTDGELYFSKLGLRIKPEAKSLIIFPGGEKYSHGVDSPGAGPVRYALPTFIYFGS